MKLIAECRDWWRFWSVRLAALAGLITGYLTANPDQTKALLELLPDGPYRVLASAALGLLVFGLATGTRMVKQTKLDKSDAG